MRRIKFKGMSEDAGEYVYGDLIGGDTIRSTVGGGIVSFKVSNGSVGQYTGLKDRNGVEIYEGDRIRLCGGRCRGLGEKRVTFEKGAFSLMPADDLPRPGAIEALLYFQETELEVVTKR